MPTANTSPIRWGILGAGAIATRFARDLAHTPTGTVAAVYARRPEAAAALAAPWSASATADLNDFLHAGIDAVYLATLPDTHQHFARAALLAGLPVLCEKPVTRSLPELDELLALAAAHNLLFMEAMKTPFLPLYRHLREYLESEKGSPGGTPPREDGGREPPLGPIRFVHAGNAVLSTSPTHPSWSLDLAGGALLSIGVYQAFLAVDHLGPALDVQALSRPGPNLAAPDRSEAAPKKPAPDPSVVDSFTLVQTRHPGNTFAQLHAGLDLASPGTATLHAPGGFITLHKPWWNPARATVNYASGRTVELHTPVLGDGLHYEAAHFAGLLRSGRRESPVVPHRTSRAVMHLLDRTRAAIGLRFPGEPFPPTP